MNPLKRSLFLSILSVLISSFSVSNNPRPQVKTLAFIENKGQVHNENNEPRPDVFYSGFDGQMTYHFGKNGFSYQLYKVESWKKIQDPRSKTEEKCPEKTSIFRTDLIWLGANPNTQPKGADALMETINFFGNSGEKGITGVKSYEAIRYNDLYNGIDVKWYHSKGRLKYDYEIKAGVDYHQIRLQIKGLKKIHLNKKGELVMQTPYGDIIEQAPLVLQNGKALKAKWTIKQDVIGFEIEDLDPAFPYIIDPAVRQWGTYYGGNNIDNVKSISVDGSSNVYMTGWTVSGNGTSIATAGAHQSTLISASYQAFLVKFNSSGIRQWGTYFGGTWDEIAYGCKVDNSGDVYITGYSSSPTTTDVATPGAHQTTLGGNSDAFLAKFNTSGVLQWSTYYGGAENDLSFVCTTDGSGNVYIAGASASTLNIATGGAHQNAFGGGTSDAFLVKFNTAGVRQWATYYGGAGNESGYGCSVDGSGNVYLTGLSTVDVGTVIATAGCHQSSSGGNYDGFLVKFDASGVRQWGTYYGGSGDEYAYGCAVDGSGNIYFTGFTNSNNGTSIATAGSHQSSLSPASYDAYLVKFNGSGVRQWATYYGGSGYEIAYTCITDPATDVYLTGYTSTNTGTTIASSPAYQFSYGGGSYDAFLAKFSSTGVRQWGTYYGGSDIDEGWSIAQDASGALLLGGTTRSTLGLASPTAHQTTFGGGAEDGFLAKFKDCDITSLSASSNSLAVCEGSNLNLSGNVSSGLTLTYSWTGPNSFTSSVQNPVISNVTPSSNGNYYFTVSDGAGCQLTATLVVTNIQPNTTVSVNSGTVCSGGPFTITPSGASTYTISGGSFVVSPVVTTTYAITGSGGGGCPSTNTAIATVSVNTPASLSISATSTLLCLGSTGTLTGSGAVSYTWNGGPTTSTYAVSPVSTSNYTLNGTAASGCTTSAVQSVSVITAPALTISPSSTVICSGKSATLTGSGASSYTWSAGPTNAVYVVSPLSNSTYTLLGTAANGCTTSALQSVSVNALPVLTITPSSTVICSGLSATLTGSGASTYTWNGGPSTAAYVVSPLSDTNYTLVATAANTCTNSAVQSISVIASPVLTITPSSTVICTGKTATLTGSGASTYTWISGPANAVYTVNPLSSSNYTLTGTAGNGCTTSAVQSISVNTTPVINITPSSTLLCSGQSATLTGSGASTYTWTGGPNTAAYVVSPTLTITYTLTASAANSCTNVAIQSISVNASPALIISPSSTVICTGNTATLTGSGANSYTWTSGPSTAIYTVNPLITTSYTLSGTALNSCTNSVVQSISVNVTPVLTITPSTTLICSGQTATFTGSGASTYSWISGPSTAANAVSPTVNTTYTVIGTAANTCTNTATQALSVNATPVLSISPSTSVICSGNSSTLTGSGANTYTWSGGPNTTTYQVSPITTTNYTLSATALNGCTNSAVQVLSVNATPTLVITPSNTLFCLGNLLTLTGSGANTYTWSGGPINPLYLVSPLTNTNYTLTGTGAGNCTNTTTYSVDVNTPPTLSIAPSSTVICSGKTSTLTASGANTYIWAAGPATTVYVVSPMSNTTFTVVGTAVNGCTNSAAQSISVNASPNLTITPSNSLVCSWTTATLTGSGANTYTWTGGPTTPVFTISPFSSVNYTLTGTAVNGCTNEVVQSISVIPSPTLSITPSSSIICSGNSATLTAGGALSYSWTGGPNTSVYVVSPATTTNYILYGTAANTCTGSVVKTISVNATPGLTILPSSTVICQGSVASLTAQGAATFTWSGGPATSVYTVNPVSNTSYTVIGETNSCTNSAVQSISVNVSPTLVIVPNNTVICSGNTVTFSASGAVSYTWEGGPTTTTYAVSPLITTSYTLNGTTAAGGNCSTSAVATISVNTTPTLSVNSGSICSGNSFVIVPNGASTYTYSGGSATVSPMSNTNYTVSGSSAAGCPALNNVVSHVTVFTTPTVTINSGSLCTGQSFTLVPGGANTYTISGGLTVVSPSVNSTYSVTGTSSLGCVSANTAVSQLTVNLTPTVSALGGTICSGDVFTITASGANTYTYSSGSNTVNPLVNSNYSISGTSSLGCVSANTAVITVSVNASPSITVNSGNLCLGQSFTISPSGAQTYAISGGTAVVSPSVNTSYSVTGTNSLGCVSHTPAIASVSVIPNPTVSVNSSSLCSGVSLTLQASGASTYSWSTGANSSSIVVSPSITSTYTVTGTSGNSCSAIAISTVSIPTPVNPSITPSSIFFCMGNSLTLTASGAPSYSWNNGSQNSSIIVSPVNTSTYSVIGTSGPGGCSNTAVYVVTVNPSPTVSISGPGLVCAGFASTLSALGALSFTWNTGAMSQFIVVNPTVTSNYTVVGMNFEGCTDTAFYQLNTTSLATPSLCLVTVDSLSNYNEVYWDKTLFPQADTFIVYRETSASIYTPIAHIPKNAFSSYVDTNRSIGPITGNPNFSLHRYKLQYIDSCGNLSAMSPFHESVKITDNLTGNFSWNYYAIEGVGPLQTLNYVLTRRNVVSGITVTVAVAAGNQLSDPQYAALSATGNMKWFVYADGFSCNPSLKTSETAAVKSRTKSNNTNERQFPTGIEQQIELIKHLIIYPNPANDLVNIKAPGELEQIKLQIMDLAGRQVFEDNFSGSNYSLDTREMNNGIYLLTLSVNGKTAVHEKIIIQH
ncbi:MAG: SBBP repeat-containing protein [Bacteroidia bacterium]|nr:SBBP repeat-containing protein [Bacteroidia bacterium]